MHMKRPKVGSTPKQYAYAQRKLNGEGRSKKEMALLSGFSQSVAENAKYKIETTEGYHNAMLEMATKSNNLVMAAMSEFEARGLGNFSNKDLIGALNAITSAWDRIEERRAPSRNKSPDTNPLRAALMQKVENQTVNIHPAAESPAPAIIRDATVTAPPSDEDDF